MNQFNHSNQKKWLEIRSAFLLTFIGLYSQIVFGVISSDFIVQHLSEIRKSRGALFIQSEIEIESGGQATKLTERLLLSPSGQITSQIDDGTKLVFQARYDETGKRYLPTERKGKDSFLAEALLFGWDKENVSRNLRHLGISIRPIIRNQGVSLGRHPLGVTWEMLPLSKSLGRTLPKGESKNEVNLDENKENLKRPKFEILQDRFVPVRIVAGDERTVSVLETTKSFPGLRTEWPLVRGYFWKDQKGSVKLKTLRLQFEQNSKNLFKFPSNEVPVDISNLALATSEPLRETLQTFLSQFR